MHSRALLSGLALAVVVSAAADAATPAERWPLWEAYAERFIRGGRVVDPQADDRTTSEGQAYGLFFALVAGDRGRFDQLLEWTEQNLAGGDLTASLPGWLWAQDHQGDWGLRDANAAADADVWLAYTLLEAGELWREPSLAKLGARLADRIILREVRNLAGLGPMLLPGPRGFRPEPNLWQLNPSYLAPQPLLGLARHLPTGPWKAIALAAPRVVEGARPAGLVLDWVAYAVPGGFRLEPLPQPEPRASYDAIRVYLWAGLLAPKTPGRDRLLASLGAMQDYLDERPYPPATVAADGAVCDPNGSVGFSAAVIPYLQQLGDARALEAQRRRVESAFDSASGLYTAEPQYYDHNLILFSQGWSENRFAFGPDGRLEVAWRNQ